MAWHCENMYGCFLFEVCAGVSHCRAVQADVVAKSMETSRDFPFSTPASRWIFSGLPYGSSLERSSNLRGLPSIWTLLTCTWLVSSRISLVSESVMDFSVCETVPFSICSSNRISRDTAVWVVLQLL